MLRLPIAGFRRREDRWAVAMAVMTLIVGLTAIMSAGYVKLQTEWDVAVATETRDLSKKIQSVFFDAKLCAESVDRARPIELKKALTSEGAGVVVSLGNTSHKIGEAGKPLLAGYVEILNIKFADAILAGKTTAGPDAYVGDLVVELRRRYVAESRIERKRIGRVMFLSEKNIFNTYTVRGCRMHSTENDKAMLCKDLGGTYDIGGKSCLASCPSQLITLNSGLKYEIPKSPSGAVKHLMNAGEVQISAACANGAWMMYDEKLKDPAAVPHGGSVTFGRLSASSD